uniref:G-protein coupled receptors family 2 profile 2 domain-containing protein n=1 Tax=Kryptolebias marmoratus TaxID=37003 RepID=A0A3Q2ZY89_KRYMA
IAKKHWEILSYISYIGCGLSAFFSAHVSLSGALFLLNSTFLLTEWGARVNLDWVCELVAALMHYSLLCCFTWMAIEALHLYLLLIKVFNTYYKHYLLKLSLAGWCWIIDDSFFYSLNLAYFTLIFILNSGILLAVGSSICKMKQVSKSNSKLRANTRGKFKEERQRFSTSCKSGLTLLGLTCLMGTTWGLAFLGSGYVNYPILYLFCILNSLQ